VLKQSNLYAEINKRVNIVGDICVSGMVSMLVFPKIKAGTVKVALYKKGGADGPDGGVGVLFLQMQRSITQNIYRTGHLGVEV
jgi:hypothetical protein